MNFYNNKVIWITGASSGIGEATAYQMAKYNCKLILTALEDDLLKEVAKKCISLGSQAKVLSFNLLNTQDIPNLVKIAISQYGKIDILYNNAGISQRSTIINTDLEINRKIMEINYYAPVILSKELLPHFIENNGGRIAVTTSIAGKFGFPLRSAYCSSKHALYGFFETLREENRENNIKVSFICPGRVKTNISKNAIDGKGIKHGKMDAGQAGGVSAQKAAIKITKAIKKAKKEKFIGKSELLPVFIRRISPRLFHWIVKITGKKELK